MISSVAMVGGFVYFNSPAAKNPGRKKSNDAPVFNFKVPNKVPKQSIGSDEPSPAAADVARSKVPENPPLAKSAGKPAEMPNDLKTQIASVAPTPKTVLPAMKPAQPAPGEPQTAANIPPDVQVKLNDASNDKSLPVLIDLLSHTHAGVRERAAVRLQDLSPTLTAVPPLIKLLSDTVPVVRSEAALALGIQGIDSPDTLPALVKSLRDDPETEVRRYAVRGLTKFGQSNPDRGRAVTESLMEAMGQPKTDDLYHIVMAFGFLEQAAKPAIPSLIKLLDKKPDPDAQGDLEALLVEVLAQNGQFEAISPIVKQKRANDKYLKFSLSLGIGRLRPMTPEALEFVKLLCADKDVETRQTAMRTLRNCEPKLAEAIPLLEQGQSDPSEEVRKAAAEALGHYNNLDPIQKIQGLLKQLVIAKPNSSESREVLDAISRTKSDGFRALVTLITNPETKPEIRDQAVRLLATHWNEEFYDKSKAVDLQKMMSNAELPLATRAACAVALGRMNIDDPRRNPTLLEAVSANTLDLEIRRLVVKEVPTENSEFLPALLATAEWCEAPLPDNTLPLAREAHQEFYIAVLKSLSHSTTESAKILPRFIAGIRQPVPAIKVQALEGLGSVKFESPEAIELVRQELKHDVSEVREAAAKALGEMHKFSAAAIPDLIVALKDQQYMVRIRAAEALGNFGPVAVSAIPELINALATEHSDADNNAEPLAKIAPRDPTVLAALIAALDRPGTQSEAVRALREIGPAAGGAVPALRKILPVSDKYTRTAILWAFKDIGENAKDAIPDIVLQLADVEPNVRSTAAIALGRMHNHAADAVPQLIKLIDDPEESVQIEAVNALGRIGPAAKSAVPLLETVAAKTSSRRLQSHVNEALALLAAEPGDADPKLFNLLLDHRNWDKESQQVLEQDEGNIHAFAQLAVHENRKVQVNAWFAISAYARRPAGREKFQQFLNGNDPRQQALAAVVLRKLPTQGDQAELAKALSHWLQNDLTSGAAADLLVRLGRHALPAFVATVTDEKLSPAARAQALDAMQQRSPWELKLLLPSLRSEMKSEIPARRQAAALALVKFYPREVEALPLVLECLNSDDHILQHQAVKAIHDLGYAEIDVKVAIPGLMKIFSDCEKDAEKNSLKGLTLLYDAGRALSLTGVRPEDIPQLRELLRQSISLLEKIDLTKFDGRFDSPPVALTCATQTVYVLSTLKGQAVDSLPEIKTLFQLGFPELRYDDPLTSSARELANLGQPAIQVFQEIASKIDNPPAARRRAARILGAISGDDDAAVMTLAELLKDSDVSVRKRAALELLDHPKHFDAAMAILREALMVPPGADDKPDPRIDTNDSRHEIVIKLRQFKTRSRAALPELLSIVNQADVEVSLRAATVAALVEIDPDSPEVLAAYIACLQSLPEHALYGLISSSLNSLGMKLVPPLIQAVEKDSTAWRTRACLLLSDMKEKPAAAIPALRTLMQSDTGEPGLIAALALAKLDPTAKDTLPRIMAKFPPELKHQVATIGAFQSLGSNAAEVVSQLIELTKEKEHSRLAFQLLGALGPAAKPALPLLKQASSPPNPDYSAHDAFVEVAPVALELAPELIARLRAGEDVNSMAKILIKMGQPGRDAVEQLRTDLKNDELRLVTINYLAAFGSHAEPALPELMSFAQGNDPDLRQAALGALSQIGPNAKPAAPFLATALSDADPHIAELAVLGLSAMHEQALPVLPQILTALEKQRPRTEGGLIELVGNLGPAARDAIPALTKLQSSIAPGLRPQVRRALEKIQAAPDSAKKSD